MPITHSRDHEHLLDEPPVEEKHLHVWIQTGLVLIAQPQRFRSRQAARAAAVRSGYADFAVRTCKDPCVFTIPRKKKRKVRRCRHCGKVP